MLKYYVSDHKQSIAMADPLVDMSESISSSGLMVDPPSPESDDVDSLPESGETSSTEDEQDLYSHDAEREWKESLQQLELLLTMVLIPYFGKYFGRKLAFYGKEWLVVRNRH